jgi:DNA-nicking Smr family endonuclease
MARHRLHGETQKRRRKPRTQALKLHGGVARPAAIQGAADFEASPDLTAQDLVFLEAMRAKDVRPRPGAGGLPARQRAIARVHAEGERETERAFQAAMAELDVRPLGSPEPPGKRPADPDHTASAARRARPAAPPAAPPAAAPTGPAPGRSPTPSPAPPKPAAPARPAPPRPEGLRFEEEPDAERLMEQALRADASLSEKFQGAPPAAPRRARPADPDHTAPDAELDLHGCTQEQAIQRVQGFVVEARQLRLRHVLIITGRGLGSGEQGPVLRQAVSRWLERHGGPYVREVRPAPPRHGGAGALWLEMK